MWWPCCYYCVIYQTVVQRLDLESSHHKEKYFFLFSLFSFLSFLWYLYKVRDANHTYRGDHFTICVSHIITLYSLDLCSDVCKSHLNTIGKKIIQTYFFLCFPYCLLSSWSPCIFFYDFLLRHWDKMISVSLISSFLLHLFSIRTLNPGRNMSL